MDRMHAEKVLAKPEVRDFVASVGRQLRRVLPAGSFAAREEAALAVTTEVVRTMLMEELQEAANDFDDEILVEGARFKHHEKGSAVYHGLSGPMPVRRSTYREMGVRNGRTVVPLELKAGLIENGTPALAYSIVHGYAQHDMRLHGEILAAAQRQPPSRTTMERIAARVAARAVEREATIEKIIRRRETPPSEARAVVIGLDRTSVPMVEDRAANAPAKAPPKRSKVRTRRPPPPFDINWRMAYVGTVSFVDESGDALHTVRYASPACDDPRALVEQMRKDVECALHSVPTLGVGIVQDGAPEMWNRTREGLQTLKDRGILESWVEGIDRYHLMERLADALVLTALDVTERHRLLTYWSEEFDSLNSTIDSVESYLRKAYARLTDGESRTKLWEHLGFIHRNKDRLRYATLRDAHMPVGSGVTESAAKTVVALRAKRSGQRWREQSLRGVLTLRAIHRSERLPIFWTNLSRTYTSKVVAA